MDRHSVILILMISAVLTGGFATIGLSLGFYSWLVAFGCVVVGFELLRPAGDVASRLINKNDAARAADKLPRKNAH